MAVCVCVRTCVCACVCVCVCACVCTACKLPTNVVAAPRTWCACIATHRGGRPLGLDWHASWPIRPITPPREVHGPPSPSPPPHTHTHVCTGVGGPKGCHSSWPITHTVAHTHARARARAHTHSHSHSHTAAHTLQGRYRCATLFVDNAGSDVVLGMLPLARELLRAGAEVRRVCVHAHV